MTHEESGGKPSELGTQLLLVLTPLPSVPSTTYCAHEGMNSRASIVVMSFFNAVSTHEQGGACAVVSAVQCSAGSLPTLNPAETPALAAASSQLDSVPNAQGERMWNGTYIHSESWGDSEVLSSSHSHSG